MVNRKVVNALLKQIGQTDMTKDKDQSSLGISIEVYGGFEEMDKLLDQWVHADTDFRKAEVLKATITFRRRYLEKE